MEAQRNRGKEMKEKEKIYVERKASEIYWLQNKIIHTVFTEIGMPYEEEKEYWLVVIKNVIGREVSGLSEMTLGERDKFIKYLQKTCKHLKIKNPAVPKSLRDWKKGEKDKSFSFRKERDPLIRKILAVWAELGYEPRHLRKLVKDVFKIDDVRWLRTDQLEKLLKMLVTRAEKKGVHYKISNE